MNSVCKAYRFYRQQTPGVERNIHRSITLAQQGFVLFDQRVQCGRMAASGPSEACSGQVSV